jgi:putative ABC transport system ATP-binding protein
LFPSPGRRAAANPHCFQSSGCSTRRRAGGTFWQEIPSRTFPLTRARIRNREVGFIFQSFNLIGDLTVFENVELPLTYRSLRSSERRTRVREALERVGMSHREKHLPSQLSGGQQQRVAVARAVAGDPLIVLADEPTGNLDSAHGEAVMELMVELHRAGATICMVTHDPRYAAYADRTIHLFDGRVVEEKVKAA